MGQPDLRHRLQGKEEAEVFLKNCSAFKEMFLVLSGCPSKNNKSEGSTSILNIDEKNIIKYDNQNFAGNRQSVNSCSLCQASHSPVEQGSAEWGHPMHSRNQSVL